MNDESDGSQPRKNEDQTTTIQNDAGKENTPNPPRGGLVFSEDPFDIKPCPRNAENPDGEKKYNIKWFKDRLEIIGILFGMGVAVLLFLQWREMVKATKITENQLRQMQKDSILDERAWVVPFEVIANPSQDNSGSMYFYVNYKNTGKTPAINAQCILGESADLNKIKISKIERPNPPANSAMIAPDAANHSTTEEAPIPKDIVQSIKSGMPFYIFGTIWYDDIFGRHHWTQFCYRFGRDFHTYPTATGNYCDDAENEQNN
jgi:hypothetical protein